MSIQADFSPKYTPLCVYQPKKESNKNKEKDIKENDINETIQEQALKISKKEKELKDKPAGKKYKTITSCSMLKIAAFALGLLMGCYYQNGIAYPVPNQDPPFPVIPKNNSDFEQCPVRMVLEQCSLTQIPNCFYNTQFNINTACTLDKELNLNSQCFPDASNDPDFFNWEQDLSKTFSEELQKLIEQSKLLSSRANYTSESSYEDPAAEEILSRAKTALKQMESPESRYLVLSAFDILLENVSYKTGEYYPKLALSFAEECLKYPSKEANLVVTQAFNKFIMKISTYEVHDLRYKSWGFIDWASQACKEADLDHPQCNQIKWDQYDPMSELKLSLLEGDLKLGNYIKSETVKSKGFHQAFEFIEKCLQFSHNPAAEYAIVTAFENLRNAKIPYSYQNYDLFSHYLGYEFLAIIYAIKYPSHPIVQKNMEALVSSIFDDICTDWSQYTQVGTNKPIENLAYRLAPALKYRQDNSLINLAHDKLKCKFSQEASTVKQKLEKINLPFVFRDFKEKLTIKSIQDYQNSVEYYYRNKNI